MPIRNGKKVTAIPNLYIKGKNALQDAVIELADVTTAPTTTTGYRYLYSESGVLKFDDGSTTYNLLTGAGGGISSWDGLYDSDKTLTIDSTTLTFALTHATNDGLTVTGSGGSAGDCIQITNSGTGKDINGTSGLWSVTKAGLATFTTGSVLGGTTLFGTGAAAGTISSNGAYDLVLETNSGTNASVITMVDGANGDIDVVMNGTGKIDMSGTTTHNTAFVVGAGDMELTLGNFAIISDWNTEATLSIQNDTATDIGSAADLGVMHLASESLTTGVLLNLSVDETGMAGGYFFRCYSQDAGAAAYTIGEKGATVIAGVNATTAALTLTAGKLTMSDGNIAVTSTDTTDFVSLTNDSLLANNALIVKGSGIFTGTTTSSFVAITPTGMTTGTALYIAGAAATTLSTLADFTTSTTTGTALRLTTTGTQTGVGSALEIIADSATTPGASAGEGVVKVSADGLTTGTALDVTSTSIALTTGRIADFSHISGNITGTLNKTGDYLNVSSFRTVTTGTVADDYDMLNLIRTSVINGGGSFSATGSVLYVENAVTNTSGTVSDTVNGIQVVMDSLGTGIGVSVTHAATGGVAVSVAGAATTVDDVLIATTGVKADNKAALQVTNSGATAAGGSVLRVINTGTPAAATSYLVDFDYSGATMTNNPTTVYVNGKDSTNSTVEINSSGASAANKGMLSLLNSNTGATGVVVHAQHTSTGSAAANDDIFVLKMEGLDAGDAVTEYCRLTAEIQVATAGQEDGRFLFSAAADNGTLTQMATLNPRAGGALAELVLGSGAGNTYLTTSGAYDLILDTNQGTNSASITLADGANGDVSVAINGTGNFNVQNLTYETNAGSPVTGTTTLTWGDAEGQVVFCTSVGGAYSITLPAAATAGAGAWYTFIKTDADANMITLDGNAAETIGEAGSAMAATYAVMDAIHDTVTIVCDGTSWYVTAQDIS